MQKFELAPTIQRDYAYSALQACRVRQGWYQYRVCRYNRNTLSKHRTTAIMSDSTVFQTISELDQQRSLALIAGDIDLVETFMGSSLHYVHSSGTDEDLDTYLKKLRNGFYKYLALDCSEQDFRRFGDTVIINGIIHVHVIANGADKDFTARYTQIWVTEDSLWKMVGWQTTLLPAA